MTTSNEPSTPAASSLSVSATDQPVARIEQKNRWIMHGAFLVMALLAGLECYATAHRASLDVNAGVIVGVYTIVTTAVVGLTRVGIVRVLAIHMLSTLIAVVVGAVMLLSR